MGSACCGGGGSADKRATKDTDGSFKETEKKQPGRFTSVPFDVIVPAGSLGPTPAGSASFNPDHSASFAAFDVTMHTMRGDASVSLEGHPANNNTFALDQSLSFTNNFSDVTPDVVRNFLASIQALGGSGRAGGLFDEASAVHSASSRAGGSDAAAAPKVVGAGENEVTQEDVDYIADGKSLEDRLCRVSEVEEVLRQNIYGSWRMNAMLMELAVARIVPTLRQRRRPWKTGDATDGTGAGSGGGAPPPKKPMVIIHAPGVEMEESLSGTPRNDSAIFSPAHMDGSPSNSPREDAAHARPAPQGSGAMDPLNRSMSRIGLDPGSAKVEHYELVALTCGNIDPYAKVKSKVINDTWDFLADEDSVNQLNGGDCLFRFMCGPVHNFDKETLDTMNLFINLSSFADEVVENNTPKVDVYDPCEADKYICISVKAMYMLPGAKLSSITPELMASDNYQKACQPSQNSIEHVDGEYTFRLKLNVIKFIFSMTVMFRVSEITDPSVLFSFKSADGIVPAKALMLERTKRQVGKVDATAKVRSMLLYYPVNGGLLVNSHTFVLNTSIPTVVAKIVNTFGSQGAAQSAETAHMTRKYVAESMGVDKKKRKK